MDTSLTLGDGMKFDQKITTVPADSQMHLTIDAPLCTPSREKLDN
jgi:hypothetical protein